MSESPARRSLAQRAFGLARWVLVGAVVNVLVAWGLAAWLPQVGWNKETLIDWGRLIPRESLSLDLYHTTGATRCFWERGTFPAVGGRAFMDPIESASRTAGSVTNVEFLELLPWDLAELLRDTPETLPHDGCEHATGWPLLTAWYGITVTPPRVVAIEGGIPLKVSSAPGRYLPTYLVRALPVRPIWIGVAVNTLVYSLLAWGFWQVPLAIRRRRRKSAGRCTRCGYSLAGLGKDAMCPECGAAPKQA